MEILQKYPDGHRAAQVLQELQKLVPPNAYENSNDPSCPDVRRYEKIVRFSTIGPVKAGWLVKTKGVWSITEEGIKPYNQYADPEELMREANRLYREWKTNQQPEEDNGDDPDPSATIEEAEEAAWAEVERHLQEMNPYDFQDLVAGLLKGMGYYVDWVSPPGKDKGIDIVAHVDPLGVRGPRIKAQVKRKADKTTVDAIRGFMAILGDTDIGVFVCTGGFTKDAEEEGRRQEKRRAMLLDLKRLFDLGIDHYDNIPERYRRLLPLRPIYYLAPDD